jgi:hypothetical protein
MSRHHANEKSPCINAAKPSNWQFRLAWTCQEANRALESHETTGNPLLTSVAARRLTSLKMVVFQTWKLDEIGLLNPINIIDL